MLEGRKVQEHRHVPAWASPASAVREVVLGWASLWSKLVHLFFGWPHPALPGTFGHIAQHEAEQRVAFPQGSTGISVRHWLSFRARRKAGLHDGVSDCCIHKKDLCSC